MGESKPKRGALWLMTIGNSSSFKASQNVKYLGRKYTEGHLSSTSNFRSVNYVTTRSHVKGKNKKYSGVTLKN